MGGIPVPVFTHLHPRLQRACLGYILLYYTRKILGPEKGRDDWDVAICSRKPCRPALGLPLWRQRPHLLCFAVLCTLEEKAWVLSAAGGVQLNGLQE